MHFVETTERNQQKLTITVGSNGGDSSRPLWDSPKSTVEEIGSCGFPWYALYTRSRHEKRLAERCRDLNIPYYLPLRRVVRRYRRRVYETDLPLFPGYLFCCLPRETRSPLYRTGHLARIIEVPDQEQLSNELIQIEKALRVKAPLEPYHWIEKGKRVRIVSGPFQGIEGIVSRNKRLCRVVLRIEFIQQVVSLEVEAGLLEPAC